MNAPPWTIAPASSVDMPELLELLERCGLPTAGVAENLPAFVVARAGGRVVGTAGVETYGTSGLLRSVAVEPQCRGHGIASELLDHWAARAEREGLSALYLLTTTAKSHFERRAFAVCPRDEAPAGIRDSWEFRTGCPDSAVFMRRELTP